MHLALSIEEEQPRKISMPSAQPSKRAAAFVCTKAHHIGKF